MEQQDMLLVNKDGRVVEVPGELGVQLLSEGFTQASDTQRADYQKHLESISPVTLAAQEQKRLQSEQAQVEALTNQPAQSKSQPDEPQANDGQQQAESTSQPSEPAENTPKKRGSK